MKKNNAQIFQELDFAPFRVYEENGLRCEFYNLKSYSKYQVYMEDLYTHFENNNRTLKILVHPDYYEAGKALFENRMIPYLFQYWPLFTVYAKRTALSKIFMFVPFIAIILYFFSNQVVYALIGLGLVAISLFLTYQVKFTARRINFLREKLIKIMTVEKNQEMNKNLDAYYTKKSELLKEMQSQKERDAEINKNIKEHLENEFTTLEEIDLKPDPVSDDI